MQGLKTASVINNNDPENLQRIKVAWPKMPDGVWAMLTNMYATNGAGFVFVPEVGDDVIIAFLDNDVRKPVVIGSVYTKNNPPPGIDRGIVTQSKLKISFDDENKIITLITPGNNAIVIDDAAKSIAITDQNNNKVLMTDEGITLDSQKDITLKANGKITMDSVSGIEIKTNMDVSIKAMNVAAEASVKASIAGSAAAELSAAGTTTIKGAIVMIN